MALVPLAEGGLMLAEDAAPWAWNASKALVAADGAYNTGRDIYGLYNRHRQNVQAAANAASWAGSKLSSYMSNRAAKQNLAKHLQMTQHHQMPRDQSRMQMAMCKMTGTMLKAYDIAHANSTGIATSWSLEDKTALLCLFAPVQGDAINEREGNQVTIKQFHLKGYFKIGSSQANSARWALVLDKQTNGTQPTASHIYNDIGSAGSMPINMFRNFDHISTFKILASGHAEFQVPAGIAYYDGSTTDYEHFNEHRFFEVNLNHLNIPVSFSGNAGDVTDIVNNSLHFVCVAEHGNLDLYYTARTRFIG